MAEQHCLQFWVNPVLRHCSIYVLLIITICCNVQVAALVIMNVGHVNSHAPLDTAAWPLLTAIDTVSMVTACIDGVCQVCAHIRAYIHVNWGFLSVYRM